jgi:putative nucleotidyltransferase with HDIG domain
MQDGSVDIKVSQEVELVISRLDSLSTLPCIATQFLSKLLQSQFRTPILADIIESDPALTARFLSILEQRGLNPPDGRFSLRQALDKLPTYDIRDILLSVKVLQTSGPENGIGLNRSATKTGLLLHSLAVACCARDIAEVASPQMDSQLAYCAGLLHDIGKLALEEIMPKSFARIIEEAASTKQSVSDIEQKHLETDHTIIGKHLAQKWRLPNLITLAIWLHHSQTVKISQDMPEARIAAVVQAADAIARRAGIGRSGSFDVPEPVQPIAKRLGINPEQIEQIHRNLPETVGQRIKTLGLDTPDRGASYSEAVRSAAVQLAKQHTELSLENRQLQSASSHLDFITDFLLNLNSMTTTLNIAEYFATQWQRFYQTGKVCLYLVPSSAPHTLKTVIIENLSQSRVVCLNVPAEISAIPEKKANNFEIVNAYDHIDWLFEELEADFEPSRTKMLPLISDGKTIGAIAFELHYPDDIKLFEEKFKTSATVAGTILGMALAQEGQQHFAENFARLISSDSLETQPQITSLENPLDVLAEMAAGAAHELNNPLAVISGRAQLLADAESDQEKKRILEQICENANQASDIIEGLMSFAEPHPPRATRTNVKQILDEAIQLASQKTTIENIDVQIKIAEDISDIFVDSAQIVSAIANVITNAVESYSDEPGPIKITADNSESGDSVKIEISDSGCGMDAGVIKKATQPFYSARTAGRKRGMGLSYTLRFIKLNKGSLNIMSETGEGTTVTIHLPIE